MLGGMLVPALFLPLSPPLPFMLGTSRYGLFSGLRFVR